MRVKFCGFTRREDLEVAVDLGVDAVGFILHPSSPRNLSIEKAIELAKDLPPYVTRVAVTVNALPDIMDRLTSSGAFDCFQLHGDEDGAYSSRLAGNKLVKAVGIPSQLTIEEMASLPVSALLLDKASEKRGGTGETLDWNLAGKICETLRVEYGKPVILSGGLKEQNVLEAIRSVHPYGIDVCSGIEKEPGIKDPEKMRRLIHLCRK
ncbi:MAG: N-(5'-phosphoribosyl)anthranilate isomerase [Candidatus Methylacidiphilales bacterium]